MMNAVFEVGAALALLLQAQAAEETISITPVEAKLHVWTDGKGHYVAAAPRGSDDSEFVFYGDGKTFWQQRVIGSSKDADGWDYTFWEPRVKARYQASVGSKDGKVQVQCEERKTELTRLTPDEIKSMVKSAKFVKPRWKHQAYAVARDNTGKYYYVDRQREPEGNKNFRLFSGPRGGMKQLKMINVVSDSEGEIFSTKSGQLRLVLGQNESIWVEGRQKTKLLLLPLEDNVRLVYKDLGVYVGQPLGTPCDDL
jgi:hypothetical protein